ncbi:MAG TPA: helix-hairpin-helix domain-containing protein [Parasegetibacter sp.]
MLAKFIRQYFVFSKKERLAAIVLVFLIGLVYSIPFFVPETSLPADTTSLRYMNQVAELLKHPAQSGDAQRMSEQSSFYVGDYSKMLHSFNDSGYRYDFTKRPDSYATVSYPSSKPYGSSYRTYSKPNFGSNEKPQYRKLSPTPIDINLADSAQWESLPGIGPKLTARILSFREKLGGFYSIDQIGEVYGLTDSVFQKIKPFLKKGEFPVRQLSINYASEEDLRNHPYIRYNGAKAISRYRNANGKFTSVEDLKKVISINRTDLEKMKPYLKN